MRGSVGRGPLYGAQAAELGYVAGRADGIWLAQKAGDRGAVIELDRADPERRRDRRDQGAQRGRGYVPDFDLDGVAGSPSIAHQPGPSAIRQCIEAIVGPRSASRAQARAQRHDLGVERLAAQMRAEYGEGDIRKRAAPAGR